MKEENFNIKKLVASDGFYLTQVADVKPSDRLIASIVCGSNVIADDWKEITSEEAEVLKESIRKELAQLEESKLKNK